MATSAPKAREIDAVLALMQGEQAQFWSYTASLATLEIRLFSACRPESVYLVCSACVSIAGPVYWERCALTVVADESDGGVFVVEDRGAGVRIVCRQVYAYEAVEPPISPQSRKSMNSADLISGTGQVIPAVS